MPASQCQAIALGAALAGVIACQAPGATGTWTAVVNRDADSGTVPASIAASYRVTVDVFLTPWGGPADLPCSCRGEVEGLASFGQIDAQPCDDVSFGCGFGVNGDKLSPDFLEGHLAVEAARTLELRLENPFASPAWSATYTGPANHDAGG